MNKLVNKWISKIRDEQTLSTFLLALEPSEDSIEHTWNQVQGWGLAPIHRCVGICSITWQEKRYISAIVTNASFLEFLAVQQVPVLIILLDLDSHILTLQINPFWWSNPTTPVTLQADCLHHKINCKLPYLKFLHHVSILDAQGFFFSISLCFSQRL